MSEAKKKTLNDKVLHWMLTGEVGISSETIACHLAGLPRKRRYSCHPLDPSDFNRCLLLLKEIPELGPLLPKMKTVSSEWSILVDRWDEVEKSFVDEVGWDWSNGKSAPRTYALMKRMGL